MPRKIFLSILGTGYYKPTNYYFHNDKSTAFNTRFIQEASIKHICQNWDKKDQIYIFLTQKARKVNWNDPAFNNTGKEPYTGLSAILKDYNVEAINIPDGNNTNEIWKVFEIIFHTLEKNDEVYFDITHAYRYLPTLLMVLINYARFLKNIQVKSISYGNWEAREEESQASYSPVVDLTPLSELQEWTNAVNDFLAHNDSQLLSKLIMQNDNRKKQYVKQISDKIIEFSDIFTTVRGQELKKGNIANHISNNLNPAIKKGNIPPLNPLLEILQVILKKFQNKENIINGLNGIEWCLDHNLMQQAITLIQEMIIEIIIEQYKEQTNHFLSYIKNKYQDSKSSTYKPNFSKELRTYVSSLLGIVNTEKQTPGNRFGYSADDELNSLTEFFFNKKIFSDFGKLYQDVSKERNSLNHGGFTDNFTSISIRSKIHEHYNELKKIIIEYNLYKLLI